MTEQLQSILVPIAPGELIDKITVLRIKMERITDPEKVSNIKNELNLLEEVKQQCISPDNQFSNKLAELEEALKKSNEEIWDMGDKIREYGESKNFGHEFAEVAYGVHLSNDHRAALKKEINLLLGSRIIEEKSYKDSK
jgi:hypothetical protein